MQFDPERVADWLVSEHRRGAPLVPFAHDHGAHDLAAAYAIQDAFVRRMTSLLGAAAGYKIGLTSRRMQQLCAIDHPVAGVVFRERVLASGRRIARAALQRVGLEFEICVRMGRDVPARDRPWTIDDIADAVDAVAPAFEVIDDRHSSYPLDLLSLVADNAWNEGIVLGEFRREWPDLAAVRGTVFCNGEQVDQGHGRDVLGHPFAPLAWLADHLAATGRGLRAGDIVSTGSLVTTRFPAQAEHYRFELDGIGAVELGIVE